jgi:hypothetical protein
VPGGHHRAEVVNGNAIDFVMVTETGTTVPCIVTQGAIDDLVRLDSSAHSEPAWVKPLHVYMNWQIEIETIASNIYDAGDLVHGLVVIAPKDR